MKTHGRLAAFGAIGVCVGSLALFVVFFLISAPRPGSGIDFEHSFITRVAVGIVIAALIGAHYAFARQLLAYVRDQGPDAS